MSFLLAVNLGCLRNRTDNNPLPNPDDITSIKAWYYNRALQKRVEFLVSPDHWESIFSALLPALRDNNPARWEEMGQLDIKLEGGRSWWVGLYYRNSPPGAFASGETLERRVYYRGGDSIKLQKALDAAYQASPDRHELD